MHVELKGTIKVVFDENKISETLVIREFVVSIEEATKYPQDILIKAINQRVELLKGYKQGDKVIVKLNLKGKENNGRYYNELTLWEIINKNRE